MERSGRLGTGQLPGSGESGAAPRTVAVVRWGEVRIEEWHQYLQQRFLDKSVGTVGIPSCCRVPPLDLDLDARTRLKLK